MNCRQPVLNHAVYFVSAGRNRIKKYCTAIISLLQKKGAVACLGNLIYAYQHVTASTEMARFLLYIEM